MREIAILGATGSIGTQALDVIARHSGDFRVSALTAHSNANELFAYVRRFRPRFAGLVREAPIPEDLRFCEWFFGEEANERVLRAAKPHDALCAVVGIAGLPAVMAALEVCERVLLANKEALVTGGALVMEEAARRGVPILPVDSEHSAIFQCLQGGQEPRRLILTASGGALRTWSREAIQRATVQDVLRHPTWRMGGKITVDCATMMNKGLEVIEAHYLFGMPEEAISVLVHPQSVVHSLVEFVDGSLLAQLGVADMRVPISYALGYPRRMESGAAPLDLLSCGPLTFEAPDEERFPCLRLAREALRAGPYAMIAMNGANEAAVAAFLENRISFGAIANIVEQILDSTPPERISCVEDVYRMDKGARSRANVKIGRME